MTRRSNTRVVDTRAQFGGTVNVGPARHKVRRPHRRKLGRPSKIRRELKVGAVNSSGLTTREHGRSRIRDVEKICLARIGRPPPAGRQNPLSEVVKRDLSSGYVGRKICASRRIGATKCTLYVGCNILVQPRHRNHLVDHRRQVALDVEEQVGKLGRKTLVVGTVKMLDARGIVAPAPRGDRKLDHIVVPVRAAPRKPERNCVCSIKGRGVDWHARLNPVVVRARGERAVGEIFFPHGRVGALGIREKMHRVPTAKAVAAPNLTAPNRRCRGRRRGRGRRRRGY